MCDGIAYNPTNQRCASNVVQTRCGTGNNDYYNPATQFCNANVIYSKCNGKEYNPTNQGCISNIVQTRCGTGDVYHNPEIETCCGDNKYTAATQFCNANKVYDKCNGAEYNPLEQVRSSFTYEGKTYGTTKIGCQVWMAENLNYSSTSGSVCYTSASDNYNCVKYGRLYGRLAALTVCPSGWHLPSNDEWKILMKYVQFDNGSTYTDGNSASIAGKYLKAINGWDSDGNGEDKYGFTALPGGSYSYSWSLGSDGNGYTSTSYLGIGSSGTWWSSDTDYYLSMSNNESVNLFFLKNTANSYRQYHVRCVQDD
jgi:uncharacterized protein (TIGR02145 family)